MTKMSSRTIDVSMPRLLVGEESGKNQYRASTDSQEILGNVPGDGSRICDTIRTIGVRGTGPGCGKDTVADYIAELLMRRNVPTHRVAFADGIRQDVSKITGIPVDLIRTPEGKNIVFETLGVTIGRILQYHGQAKKKLEGDDVWIKQCIDFLPTDRISIISDVRYKQEQIAVINRNGIIIMVRSDRPTSAILMAGRSSQHSSERDLDGVPSDYVIDNNGTLEELKLKVEQLVNGLPIKPQ